MVEKTARLGYLLLVVGIAGWFGVVRPQIKAFSDKLLQTKARSVEAASYKKRLADVELIKAKGQSIQSILTTMYLAMPKSSQIPEALVIIDHLSSQSGVTISTASLGAPSGQEVPVSMSFSGSLDNISRFLDAVNRTVRSGVIKSQFITSDSAGNLTANIQLGLVYQGGDQ